MLEKDDQLKVVNAELDRLLQNFAANGFDPLSIYLTLYSYTVRMRSIIITSGSRDEVFMSKAEDLTMKGLAIDKKQQELKDRFAKKYQKRQRPQSP